MIPNSLSLEDVRKACPSVFAKAPSPKVSERYTFVSTADILKPLLDQGWAITHASQRRVNKSGRDPSFTRHMVRMRHSSAAPFVGGVHPEVVIINSHDRQCRFQIRSGLFRLVCSNGMVIGIGKNAGGIMTHIGDQKQFNALIDAALKTAVESGTEVAAMQKKKLDDRAQVKFARDAYQIAYGDEDERFDAKQLLTPRREEDKTNDLWTVYNRVQENIMRGGLKYQVDDRTQSSRAITHIGRNIEINGALWDLAALTINGKKPH